MAKKKTSDIKKHDASVPELKKQNEELREQNKLLVTQSGNFSKELKDNSFNHELYFLTAEYTDNAVLICDNKGNIEWVNKGFINLSGYTLEEFTSEYGKNIFKASVSDDFEKHFNESLEKKAPVIYTSTFTNKHGLEIWVQTTLVPIFNDDYQLRRIVIIDTNITHVKRADEEVRNLFDIAVQRMQEIERQRDEIDEQKQSITDSIEYAKHIQYAILPANEMFDSFFSDHFVMFKPRDIVSGDFYWITHIENQTLVAVGDCTGHGVPGALMSMLGSAFLTGIINKEYITHTGVILKRLRKEVIKALRQKGDDSKSQDGMDIALCSIDNTSLLMQFSGANNPIFILRDKDQPAFENTKTTEIGDSVLYEIKGDRMPISIYLKMDKFVMHEIQLQKGDLLYMFSDGYVDQFGGPKERRYMSKPFKKLLLENKDKPMSKQKAILESSFEDWRGEVEQVDDVCVVGLKI